jgi:hypothetical protein
LFFAAAGSTTVLYTEEYISSEATPGEYTEGTIGSVTKVRFRIYEVHQN